MPVESFEVTLKYIIEVAKSSTSFNLTEEVAKIIDEGEISAEFFGQTFAFDMRASLSFLKNDASWSIRVVEKKTNRELCIENRHTGQYSFKSKHFSFISKEPSVLPKYKPGHQSWGLRTRCLYVFKTKSVGEIKEEIEEQVNFHRSFSTSASLSGDRYINPGSLYAWPRPGDSLNASSPASMRQLLSGADNENYDASTEMNHPIYVAANAQHGPPRRFFSESQADNANYLNDTHFSARNVFNSNSNSSGSYSSHGQTYPLPESSESRESTRTSLSKTSGSCEDGGYLQAVPNPGPKFMTIASIDLNDPKSVEFEEADNLNYLPGSHLTESECSNSSRGAYVTDSVKQRSKTLPTKKSNS